MSGKPGVFVAGMMKKIMKFQNYLLFLIMQSKLSSY